MGSSKTQSEPFNEQSAQNMYDLVEFLVKYILGLNSDVSAIPINMCTLFVEWLRLYCVMNRGFYSMIPKGLSTGNLIGVNSRSVTFR